MTIPAHIAEILAEAKHNPAAYRKLRDFNPLEVRPDPMLARFTEATHAYGATRGLGKARRPSGMFELGAERVRLLVQPQAQRWLDTLTKWRGGSLVVCGPTGLGKTAGLVHWCLTHPNVRWQWVDGAALGNANRRSPLGETPELIEQAINAKVLILDDPDHARDRDPFIEVLRGRYAAAAPTFVATGKRWAELDEFYGDAVLRRMVEGTSVEGAIIDLWIEADKEAARQTRMFGAR